MALAKERILEGSQTRSLYGNVHGGGRSIQGLDPSSVHVSSYKGHNSVGLEDGEVSGSLESYSRGIIVPLLSDPSNSPSGSFVFGPVDSSLQEAHSVVNFKAASDHWAYSGSSVLSFEKGDTAICTNYQSIDQEDHESGIWMDAMDQNYQLNHRMSNAIDDNRHGSKEQFGLLNLGVAAGDGLQESVEQENGIQKRPYTGGDLQASKKHCGNTRKTKAPKPGPSKDPQSIAAKNRRERISDRLKILQDLVPNGSKVDLVTMLEKAISYVKFLQLQVKVLATDEFWPAHGGKAPDVSQVKEAIDAILSSHGNRNSSSK